MFESPLDDSMALQHQKATPRVPNRMAMSARKLAATLWELQEISLSSSAPLSKVTNEGHGLHLPETPMGKRNASHLPFAPSPASSHVSMRALRRSSVKCRFGDGTKRKPSKTCPKGSTTHMQVLKLLEDVRPVDCPSDEEDTHEIEVDDGKCTNIPSFLTGRAVTDGNGGSTTSTELLKVLNRVWDLEELHKSSTSVISTLQSDLESARLQIKDLTIQQVSHYREMESLNKQLNDEKAEWLQKEQEMSRQALQSLKEELEEERKSKRKHDLLHRKASKELIDVKKSLMKALQDREREQKARELIEDVCDELAREVGEDKARVEALKRESIKVREEVEEERKMLQVAEVWREERVQMKLAEARLEIEEKNTALDNLRLELDAFLKAKRASELSQDGKGSAKVNLSTEGNKTSAFTNEKQSSPALARVGKETYEVVDEHRSLDVSSVDVEIKGTIPNIDSVNGRSSEYSFESTDDDDYNIDDEVDAEEDQADLHSIELTKDPIVNKDSYMREVKSTYLGRMNDSDYVRDLDSRGSVDQVNSPFAEKNLNQGASMGGLETTNITQVEAMDSDEENKDRVKMWNLELNSPPWRTEVKSEKVDKRVLMQDSKDANVDDIKSSLKGEKPLPLDQDEPKGDTYLCTSERDMKVLGSNGTFCEPHPSLSLEAVTNGVWSLQNLGASREIKGVGGVVPSSMQQCASPTRKWGHSLSGPADPVRSQNASSAKATSLVGGHSLPSPDSVRPQIPKASLVGDQGLPSPDLVRPQSASNAKASVVGGAKTTKEKIVKGKIAEAKADTRQPRSRICKTL